VQPFEGAYPFKEPVVVLCRLVNVTRDGWHLPYITGPSGNLPVTFGRDTASFIAYPPSWYAGQP
jgi:hypothetical protein